MEGGTSLSMCGEGEKGSRTKDHKGFPPSSTPLLGPKLASDATARAEQLIKNNWLTTDVLFHKFRAGLSCLQQNHQEESLTG